jgi:hypothetical protein
MMEGAACHRDLSDVIAAFFIVIASEAWQSQESKTQKSKCKMTEQK